MRHRRHAGFWAGFTLIELMIAVAIVGILLMVALPSYRDSIRKGYRNEAMAHLQALAAKQQQMLVDTRSFASSIAALNLSTPANVATAYSLGITSQASPPEFTITATPGTDQGNDKCGVLTIDQTGKKTATKSGSEVSGCW